MAPKIIKGFDEKGREIFSREAREYDRMPIEQRMFGISVGDLVKAIPVIFAAGIMFAHFQNSEANQNKFNTQITTWVKNDAEKTSADLAKVSSTLQHIDVSLTQITGHAFNDGLPMPGAQTQTTTTTVQ